MEERFILECRGVRHWFGDRRRDTRKNVLYDINLKIIPGEIVSLVGPSGCGKSTLLRAIVGTHPPREGNVLIYPKEQPHREEVVSSPSWKIGIVYQRYSLFPFLTALKNVAIGPLLDQTSIPFRLFKAFSWRKIRKEHLQEAKELLEKIGLGDAINQYPSQMSGGMCQRVAIAQALIMKPEVLLLDEPFGALDEATREELQKMLLTLYLENLEARRDGKRCPYTVLIVTHELNEAIYVGDRVVGLSQYWNWKEKDHQEFPGATIIYDRVAPVYGPDQERNFGEFFKQRNEIRKVVFEPTFCQDAEQFKTFWQQVKDGKGEGVLNA